MHSKDLNPKGDDTINIPDNMPLGVAQPPQLGDARNFGESEPVAVPTGNELDAPPRVHEDTRDEDAKREAERLGETNPTDSNLVGRVHTEGGDTPVEVLREGPDGDANLTDPPLLGDAGGQAALTQPGGPTSQAVLNDPSINADGTPIASDNSEAEEIEPLDRPRGDEAIDSPTDTRRTLGAQSSDGKWYARNNDGESRAFDTEADRDDYVNNQQGWSAYVAE